MFFKTPLDIPIQSNIGYWHTSSLIQNPTSSQRHDITTPSFASTLPILEIESSDTEDNIPFESQAANHLQLEIDEDLGAYFRP